MMNLVCPHCSARFSLASAIQDVEARRALETILGGELPLPVMRRLLPYVALHASPGRAVAWDKVARLAGDLADLIKSPALSRGNGRPRAISSDLWAQALDEVLEARDAGTLRQPLRGHGYLTEVAYRLADKAEAQAERATEDRRRGVTPAHAAPAAHAPFKPEPPPRRISETGMQQGLAHIQALMESLGRRPRPDNQETTP